MSSHQWQFFRSGGFDQVRLDRISDWQQLATLDQKLWAALACPTQGLEFDARTLAYIDLDGDGRVRVPEILAAVKWALAMLKQPEVLLQGEALPLSAINDASEEGVKLLASAREMLTNLGRSEASLRVEDTADLARIFPANRANGDGIVPAELSNDAEVKQLIADIISCHGAETDRSGAPGITQAKLDAFVADANAYVTWAAGLGAEQLPFGEQTAALSAALTAVRAKIDDYFVRCDLASYDARAVQALNGSEAELAAIGSQLLNTDRAASESLPLARIEPGRALPLTGGINPAWQAELDALRPAIDRLTSNASVLSKAQWETLKAALQPYLDWQAKQPSSAVSALGRERLQAILSSPAIAALTALIADDLAHKAEASGIVAVDKLVRYQRYLRVLLNNFVNFRDFFARKDKAVFQNGTLYLDGRSCDLVVRVNDAGKHGALAGLSRAYLLYCDCLRKATGEKITVVAAVTAGDAGNLMVGRNGIYYDRAGNDWDATVTKIVENPISVREAFFTPYRRVARMISEQAQKFAASKDKAIEEKSAAGVTEATGKVTSGEKPAAPAPFDVAKFAGIFAAIGLAIGAIGTAFAAVVSGFMSLSWWQMPLAFAGVLLLISGPSMIMAWFKLRQRNLGPILDANGWAVNTMAKINIPFGTALTSIAVLPAGSERALTDPYAEKRTMWPWYVLLLLVIAAGMLWYKGILQLWLGLH
ncbi:hypothetical protein HPT27_15145 [Permianibacter sp. IMCC34836]|uniref:hypothetical protein n=1 Tax=Permianibacter fluminis TaxID=2738515 RepID=UPI001552ECA7|nr:hypothetical protein [Permianibacter fluminis]NQD38362.1 hypothetical protein [Permianibacter fluminis]